MNYHNILHDDMRNGDGLRVTLFVSGCDNKCEQCQNPQTWDINSGIEFDLDAQEEIFNELKHDYISGITLSGGDPLYETNLNEVFKLLYKIRTDFPDKTIWIYSGYKWEDIEAIDYVIDTEEITSLRQAVVALANVLVDGKFDYTKADVKYHWAGSTNQRVIDVQKSLEKGEIVLWET